VKNSFYSAEVGQGTPNAVLAPHPNPGSKYKKLLTHVNNFGHHL
jgi:hypothetical protein